MAKLDAFFKIMHENKASDLHLATGQQPIIRVNGEMKRIKYNILDNNELKSMLYEIAPEEKVKKFEETGDVDFSYEIPGLARYRANLFRQTNGVGAAFREIPNDIKTIEELGLPASIAELAMLPRGLVLVTGPTGSGKSTTLAALVDIANRNRNAHIITIEDPVEFVHQSKGCLINQREVGLHTKSFSAALHGALREDPDIILVGEMRDRETIALVVEAASTGHLVFATVHTSSADKTVDRIIEVFPAEEQAQIRTMLADSIKGVISQVLVKRTDEEGRTAAVEILTGTPAIRNLIREAKTHQIPSMIQVSKRHGMQLLDDVLLEMYNKKQISAGEAYEKANDKDRFRDIIGDKL